MFEQIQVQTSVFARTLTIIHYFFIFCRILYLVEGMVPWVMPMMQRTALPGARRTGQSGEGRGGAFGAAGATLLGYAVSKYNGQS